MPLNANSSCVALGCTGLTGPLPCWAGAWGRRAPCPQDLLFFAFVGTERPPLSSLINLARPCAKFALYNSDRAKTTKLN